LNKTPSSILNPPSPPTDRVAAATSLPYLGLPHRPPFVFVREIVDCDPGRSVAARTSFAADDPMFAGHFPGNPLVPGVIITEALAQTAGIAAASGYPEPAKPLFLLSAIRTMKFPGAIRPDEEVDLYAEMVGQMEGMVQFKVVAAVQGRPVAEGQLVLSEAANFARAPE